MSEFHLAKCFCSLAFYYSPLFVCFHLPHFATLAPANVSCSLKTACFSLLPSFQPPIYKAILLPVLFLYNCLLYFPCNSDSRQLLQPHDKLVATTSDLLCFTHFILLPTKPAVGLSTIQRLYHICKVLYTRMMLKCCYLKLPQESQFFFYVLLLISHIYWKKPVYYSNYYVFYNI